MFPYLLWGICALLLFLLSSLESTVLDFVLIPFMIYVLGIILWLIPYTLLAVGMWIWSRNKSTATLYKLALIAPVLLVVLMLIESTMMSLPAENIAELAMDTLRQAATLGGFSLLFGYLCVGAALGIYKFLQAKELVAEEKPSLLPEA
jgi:hypothetical protein